MKKIFLLFGLILAVIVSSTDFTMAQRRKMSSQAKGALIGGAGGAIAGGLIGHGVKGALIGGAIGAGGGYVIGNEHRRNKAKGAPITAHITEAHVITADAVIINS